MYTVYVLQDDVGKLYKGCTSNYVRRFSEHINGRGGRTTSAMKGLKVVYKEEYKNFQEARKRELYLKSATGRKFLKIKLRS